MKHVGCSPNCLSRLTKKFWTAYLNLTLALSSRVGGHSLLFLLLNNLYVTDSPFEGIDSRPNKTISLDNPYYPWPSKAHFITAILFNSARLPFSDAQKQAILTWVKEPSTRDDPSLYAVKKCQQHIENTFGIPTEIFKSQTNNLFYLNDVAKAVAMDYSNPLTRFAMQDYPEDSSLGMSEVYHGEKMLLELPSPPAARVDGRIFFVDELLQDCSGMYFIPERFFYGSYPLDAPSAISDPTLYPKELCALGCRVGFVVSDVKEIVRTTGFMRTFKDLSADPNKLLCGLAETSSWLAKLAPHPLHAKANGRMVYSVPLIIFMDDMSGNISKQWNKHHAIYMSNANFPCVMIEKEFCVRFVTTSPHAPPMELMKAMKESISKASDVGVVAWDCKGHEEVLLDVYGLFLAGDNPMQAEECSHTGLRCNYFCWTCHVGGTQEYKHSEEGYYTIFSSGELWAPEGTMTEICRQISLALGPGATEKLKSVTASTGLRDSLTASIVETLVNMGKKMRKHSSGKVTMPEADIRAKLEQELSDYLQGASVRNMINPLLGMKGINIHLDTPTEVLHTILLGIVKYFWGQIVFVLEKVNLLHVLQGRLDSVNRDGLNAPSLNSRYIYKDHRHGLNGKHFKGLAQVMSFLIFDIVPQTLLDGWSLIGKLVVLIWHTQINNTEKYLAQLTRTINDFLNVACACAPSILITKPKFHFLVHLPAYIRRFGPAIIFSTKRYESFNHVFRLACIHSNQQAPSRDACKTFACHDIIRHIVTGGFWFDQEHEKWVCGGKDAIDYLPSHLQQAHLFRLSVSYADTTGRVALVDGLKNKKVALHPVLWGNTCSLHLMHSESNSHSSHYYLGSSLTTSCGDVVHVDQHAIACSDGDDKAGKAYCMNFCMLIIAQYRIGHIKEILVSTNPARNVEFIVLQLFVFAPSLHPQLHLPCLTRLEEEVVVHPKDIMCSVNLQHNCVDAKCGISQWKPICQEHMQTSRTSATVNHKPTPEFFLNIYSIHNYAYIHDSLPEHLRVTPLWVPDVQGIRKEAVQKLQMK
ncbi:hypothetical protein SCLCIDRAFT_105912, partial [Scleroderma citrinum Foug A]